MVQTGPKRAVQAGAGLALVAGLLALPVTAAIANPATGQLATPELAVSDATSSLASHASALRASAADKFTARGSLVDANGVRHVRFDRTYQGLPVLGGDIIAHNSANGAFLDASVTLSAPLNLAVTPKISAADATATGITRFTGTKATQAAPRLAVDATGAPALVWQVIVAGTDAQGIASRLDVTVDALTGAIRSSHETIPTLAPRGTTAKAGTAASVATVGAAAGTGNGLYSGSVPISINQQSGGLYELKDPTRGNTEIDDAQNKSAEAGVPITSSTTTFGNGTNSNRASAGVDASYGAAKTWDYYKNVLGRTGIDGSGTGAHMYVHYGNAYDNAYWSDGCYCMVFGDGSNNKSFTELDVIGHEMSHGVTSRTAALDYSGDAGGLNEANSDIFGTEVEFYAANANDNPDYLIGELLDLNGNGTPLRYMDDPHKDGVSDTCWTTATGGKDPHYSSGVGNHLFFLLAVGSGAHTVNGVSYNSPTCASAPAVTGIGNDKAGKIWFKALSTYMNATESYPKARIDTIHAANDMITAGTATNADCTNLKAAWKAAGVAVQTTEAACLGGGGNSAPTVTNPGNQTTQVSTAVNLQIAASDADGDALTYSATGLPAGLSINASTGKITGTTAATASSNSVVVSVKDPTHTAVTASFTWAVTTTTPPTCTVTQIGNSGFETGAATPWTASSGVVDNSASQAAHGGSWKAWMNGYGSTHADSLSQSIKVPSGCASVSLQYYLHIDTAETGSTVYDKLTVTVGTTTVASYSNVNAAAGYQLRTVNLSAFAGQTVTLKFAGSEDSSLQTSFVVDDVTIVGS